MQASCPPRARRPQRTTSERAVPARGDDRNRGRKQRKPATAVERLLIVLTVAEPTPSPTETSIRACAPCERATSADARRHAIWLLNIGVAPAAPSSSSANRLVEPGATT
jgi:hypothetical protein